MRADRACREGQEKPGCVLDHKKANTRLALVVCSGCLLCLISSSVDTQTQLRHVLK